MEDDDWDLHAVVRGCAASFTTTTATSAVSIAAAAYNPSPYFPSNFPSHGDQNSLEFPGLMDDGNEGLHQIYQEFCAADPPPTAAASMLPSPPALVLQTHQKIMQSKPPLRLNMQIQENVHSSITPTIPSPPQNFPATIPQPVRPRRRKKQQMKLVRQMTQEELSADSWAWRKYGQKLIKASPYPRNYYRCSTSKGCAARKQVERSPNDPEIFVVSYSGEHTHPRPTHRSSLAGSTRSKLASPAAAKGYGGSSNAAVYQKATMAASSSSPAAGSSFSLATPSMEPEAAAQNEDLQMAEDGDGDGDGAGDDDDDENVIMIPSDLINDDDDMLRGFQDCDDHSSGGDIFSSGLLSFPAWTPTSSTATFNGGSGD